MQHISLSACSESASCLLKVSDTTCSYYLDAGYTRQVSQLVKADLLNGYDITYISQNL